MTAASHSLQEISEFWTVARRLHTIYAELDRTFELGMPPCPELEKNADCSNQETFERVRHWFHDADSHIHVWQFRQLLQSTNLQTEENLRYLILRHLDKEPKAESDKEKIDFLLVQYFAHCAPEGVIEHPITLEGVGHVLEPALGPAPARFPDWTARLDEKLAKMNDCNSLEELQESGGLGEAREMKAAAGDRYFEPDALIAFTRFNFLARRAFFRAMHIDLHAIRSAVNELEKLGFSNFDCRDAGLSEKESVEQLRHVVHQWKTPFRAPYSAGGESFHQLIALRRSLQQKLEEATSGRAKAVESGSRVPEARATPSAPPVPIASVPPPAAPVPQPTEAKAAPALEAKATPPSPPVSAAPSASATATKAAPAPDARPAAQPAPAAVAQKAAPAPAPPVLKVAPVPQPTPPGPVPAPVPAASPAPAPQPLTADSTQADTRSSEEDEETLQRALADIADQLAAVPPKNTPGVSTIHLGGCKLMIATWEADAFKGDAAPLRALQRAVAARTILHVCMERYKKNEATDLEAAVEIAQRQAEEMKAQVMQAKEASNIDAAVNLAATAKRLMALVEEGLKMRA
jgi:hypothetical protein